MAFDLLVQQKSQLESAFSSFGAVMHSMTFSMSQYISDRESQNLLIEFARKYPYKMGCSQNERGGVYIDLTETTTDPVLITDKPFYGIDVKILDHKQNKYRCSIDICDEFLQLHPEYSVECNGRDALYATVDKFLREAEGAVAEYVKTHPE